MTTQPITPDQIAEQEALLVRLRTAWIQERDQYPRDSKEAIRLSFGVYALDEAIKSLERGEVCRYQDEGKSLEFMLHRNDVELERVRTQPIDMLLFCPNCGRQHIDEPQEQCESMDSKWHEDIGSRQCQRAKGHRGEHMCNPYGANERWTNPPHKSHLCRIEDGGCGVVWRPADVPTNGVALIKTRGERDTLPMTNPLARLRIERDEALATVISLDLTEGHVRDNADPDQLRAYLYGAGLLIVALRIERDELRATLERFLDHGEQAQCMNRHWSECVEWARNIAEQALTKVDSLRAALHPDQLEQETRQ